MPDTVKVATVQDPGCSYCICHMVRLRLAGLLPVAILKITTPEPPAAATDGVGPLAPPPPPPHVVVPASATGPPPEPPFPPTGPPGGEPPPPPPPVLATPHFHLKQLHIQDVLKQHHHRLHRQFHRQLFDRETDHLVRQVFPAPPPPPPANTPHAVSPLPGVLASIIRLRSTSKNKGGLNLFQRRLLHRSIERAMRFPPLYLRQRLLHRHPALFTLKC